MQFFLFGLSCFIDLPTLIRSVRVCGCIGNRTEYRHILRSGKEGETRYPTRAGQTPSRDDVKGIRSTPKLSFSRLLGY